MLVQLHHHTLARMRERGATESEVLATIETGERFAAKRGRSGFRKRFACRERRRGRRYFDKEILAYAVGLQNGWLVITVVVKYLRREETLQ